MLSNLAIQNGNDFVNAQNLTSGFSLQKSNHASKYSCEKKSPAVWMRINFAFSGNASVKTFFISSFFFPRTASKLHHNRFLTLGYLSVIAA
jgi:hypothetical protein